MTDLLSMIAEEVNNFNDLTGDNEAYTLKELCDKAKCCRERMNKIMQQKEKDGIVITGYKRYNNGKAKAWKLKHPTDQSS